jgi:uncharacterized protein (DUF427 family)
MIGTGPFGHVPGGAFSTEMPAGPLLYLEESPRWVRVRMGGETVVSSKRPRLLHESGRLPVFYFPEADVRTDLLRPSERSERDHVKGNARFWSLAVGDRVAEDAAWCFDHPQLDGLVALRWDAADEWLEEDETQVKHARDPYHRLDVRSTSRHVSVSLAGERLADSRRTRILFETGLPPRFYFPADDVRQDVLEPSDRRTACAYKGVASYWSVRVGEELEPDLVWFYVSPLHDAAEVRDMLAFFNERIDLDVDGERWERPRTQWSRSRKSTGGNS